MKLTEAIKHALDGNSVLFLGSGFSLGAKNLDDKDFMTGNQLSKFLCDELKIAKSLTLDIVSEIYAEKFGVGRLISLLKRLYSVSSVSNEHVKIASMPWRRVYTTNYDDVFEYASKAEKKHITPITLAASVRNYLDRESFCLHLNGFINGLTPESVFNEFKLTSQSYLTSEFNRSKWSSVFRQDINLAKSVIFIGYSLYDLDIARVLYDIDAVKEKCVFVVGDDPSIAETYKIKQLGRLTVGGTKKFSETLSGVKDNYVEKENVLILKAFKELVIEDTQKLPTDDDRYGLLLRGDLNHDLVFSSLDNVNKPYTVRRTVVDDVLSDFERGQKYVVVHGDLGNGKTVIAEQVACSSLQRGRRVFFLDGYSKYAQEDLLKIIKTKDRSLLIVEDYNRYLDFVRDAGLRDIDFIAYLFTERSALHEYYIEELIKTFTADGFVEHDCNKLFSNEIDAVKNLLNIAGLWGGKSSLSESMKANHIKYDLHAEFQGVLLDVLNSPLIKARLLSVFKDIAPGSQVHQIVLLAFVLKYIGHSSTVLVISELLGIDSVRKKLKDKGDPLREVLTINSGNVVVKSSVLAKFFLAHLGSGAFLVDVLVTVYSACEELKEINIIYKDIQRDLRRYSVLQGIFQENNRRELLIGYYEDIKNLPDSLHNPFFWVQYGIARLAFKDYEIACSCFIDRRID